MAELQIWKYSLPFSLLKWFVKLPLLFWVRNNHLAYCSACTTDVGPIGKDDNIDDDISSSIILHIRSQVQFFNFIGGFGSFRFEINLLIMS